MLLIYPPAAKPSEAPAGVAKLAGALKASSVPCKVLDANLEGLLWLLAQPGIVSDTWSRRAIKNVSANIAALRNAQTYRSFDRYSRAANDVNRVLGNSGRNGSAIISLADYQDGKLSPIRSIDLLSAAEHPEENVFYPYFKKRLPELIEKLPSQNFRDTANNPRGSFSRRIGFSLNYLSQALCAFAMIGYVRKEFEDVTIILGGGLVTSWMKKPGWKSPFGGLVDHMIAGPGEVPLLKLLGSEAPGQKHFIPDFDSLPLQHYLSPGFVLPYSASSGCYWSRCSFCPETAEDNTYVPVPPVQARADLSVLSSSRKPVMVHLLDNSVSPALMAALSGNPLGIPWYGFARVSKELADREYCKALRHSGCVMLKLGLESGDQGVLDKMQKGIDLETMSGVLKNLRHAGIATYVYLLFGTPVETVTEARKTLEFVIGHQDAITFLNLAVFNMPVCGQEAGAYETEKFYEGDLSLYTGFRHPSGWDRKQVRMFLENEFKRNSAVSAILRHDPPFFTSNHAPFLTDIL